LLFQLLLWPGAIKGAKDPQCYASESNPTGWFYMHIELGTFQIA
jgi:hypothetical protein